MELASGAPGSQAIGPARLAWEDPPRAPPPGTAPVLSVAGFEGPLDWLVEMARARKIDLARLSIVALVQAFCAAMAAALPRAPGSETPHPGQAATASGTAPRPVDLARWADWLVMAATLTQLRSRLLLPADRPEALAAQSEAELLRRQIVGRAQMAAAADWLDQRPQLGREVFSRGIPGGTHGSERTTDLTDLLRACLVALWVPEDHAAAYQPKPPPFWTVSDAMERIQAILEGTPEGVGLGACLPRIGKDMLSRELRCRAAVASTFVAGLELARGGIVSLVQQEVGYKSVYLGRRHKPKASSETHSRLASG